MIEQVLRHRRQPPRPPHRLHFLPGGDEDRRRRADAVEKAHRFVTANEVNYEQSPVKMGSELRGTFSRNLETKHFRDSDLCKS